jgi:hypothetical protein
MNIKIILTTFISALIRKWWKYGKRWSLGVKKEFRFRLTLEVLGSGEV